MRRAEVSVHVDQRRLPCVLEPALLLAHAQGPSLALRLVAAVEPWLTRSFWQALDNSELLTGHLAGCNGVHGLSQAGVQAAAWGGRDNAAAVVARNDISEVALTRWIQLRERTDESAWVLRWIGDRIAESQLREVEDLSLFDQFEVMQASLELRAERRGLALRTPWPGLDLRRAALDALSLSAVLEGALVLCSAGAVSEAAGGDATASDRDADGAEPMLVVLARQLGFIITDVGDAPAALPDEGDRHAARSFQASGSPRSLFTTERQLLREALARAGLATLAQRLPPLAVLHVVVDSESEAQSEAAQDGLLENPHDPWRHAQVWWYWL